MSQHVNRLPGSGRIDRSRPLRFTFDGVAMTGYAGDTLASALLDNGVTLVGRSFKYHRPRGIYTAGPEEPNALVTLGRGAGREPNVPATTVELVDGLEAESQNRGPSLRFDPQSINGLFAPLLSAGFYYKTFMGPTRRAWMAYEPMIRRAAGLGRASHERDPDRYEVRQAFADVAVVGSGPAGLSAALAAGRAGARVLLVEQDFALGGSLLSEPQDGPPAAWLATMVGLLAALPNVTLMPRTTAFGLYDANTLALIERRDAFRPDPTRGEARQGTVVLAAGSIIFATGAIERPLVFPNNDRPGVMLASAARSYLNRFGILPGRRILVATNNDSAYRVAVELAATGASVTLADLRQQVPAPLASLAGAAGVAVRAGIAIADLSGSGAVRSARLSAGAGHEDLACELVCVSGGWSPSLHLTSHLGSKPRFRDDIGALVPGRLAPGQFAAGAVQGGFATADVIEEGHRAGLAAAIGGRRGPAEPPPGLDLDEEIACAAPGPIVVGSDRGKAFVDLQNDVTADDVRLAHREGYESVEHLKRYTTLGMGTDQGKTSNLNALSLMAKLRRATIPDTGTTTFRPPYTPVAIGALAGRSIGHHCRPIRRTPMHDWHVENGAEMLEVGLWMRPWFYRAAGRDVNEAYVGEMRVVREAAGLMDISTLGKVDVQGPDAAAFLDRVYVNRFSTLPVGRARYGVMLRDDGIVLDDGTTTRLGEHRFFVTSSTAKAADVMSWLEFLLEVAWPELRVAVTSVTDEWAAMSVAGPRSREVLAAAFPGLDLSDGALPHMGLLEADRPGCPIRILRLSYSGERAYEVYVRARHGRRVWEALLTHGGPLGLRPYGVEALGALRVEKGHVAGPEIDGRTVLSDLGLERMPGKKTSHVGSVLQHRPAFREADRPRLVGLDCIEADKRLRGGAVLFRPGDAIEGHGRGRITSVTYSPTLGRYIGLALYAGGMAAEGTEVVAVYPMKNETVRARVVSPVFLDPKGERLHG